MANLVWNSRDETGRGNNWKNEEVIDLLNTIKKNNLMKGSPSGKQLGQLVEPLMGFRRTAFQITGKLKNLRMSYLSCKRQESTEAAHRKCPYYNLLSEIYSDKVISIEAESSNDMVKGAEQAETEIMVYLAEELGLSPGPRLQKISHKLMHETTTKGQIEKGSNTTPDQVENILKAQIKSLTKSKECKSIDQNEALLLVPKIKLDYDSNRSDSCSNTETSAIQKIIKESLSEEAENVSKISRVIRRKGCHRSALEIREKLEKIKNTFLQPQPAEDSVTSDIFKDKFLSNDDKSLLMEEKKSSDDEPNSTVGKTKHSRSRAWSDVETSLMLSLLQDFNLTHHIAHRLSLEVVQEIVEPLRQRGYARSPMQIQIKLRNLRKSYYKCLRAGCTKMAIAKCPFFHKLNEIYEKSHLDTKFPRDRISETIQTDHEDVLEPLGGRSYYNTMPEEPLASLPRFQQRTSDTDSDSSQMWMPVETICGEDFPVPGDDEKPGSAVNDPNESNAERKLRIENYDIKEETNGSNDDGDSNEDSIALSIDEQTEKDTWNIYGQSKKANGEEKRNVPSQKSLKRFNSSRLRPMRHKLRKNNANPYSPKAKKDSSTLRTMRYVMAQLLRHEKMLQRQHHSWMERQFEIQRKHNRDHRELLLKELREFRKSFNLAMPKQQTANNQRVD